jgi:hypothetical protein
MCYFLLAKTCHLHPIPRWSNYKLPHQQVGKTLWKDEEPEKEKEILAKLQSDGVWTEMEKDFKTK